MPQRVLMEAVPGAGKTRALLRLCQAEETALVLAYNAQLAHSMAQHLPPHAECLTFHALCQRCLGPARDDSQLEACVQAAEQGLLEPKDVPDPSWLLLDEAQDVRPLYLRLLRVLGLFSASRNVAVAGDRNQLVYDFDEDFPASLELLTDPGKATGLTGECWKRQMLHVSHRLTVPMAALVNALFRTQIQVVKVASDATAPPTPLVEVRCPRTSFALHGCLRDVLATAPPADTLLLVDRKQGNRPLRALLNDTSRSGAVQLHVHGVDPGVPQSTQLRCLTYWSSKGLECDTAIVLVPQRTASNPLYVALTRARRRLVIVMDPCEPHAALCNACAEVMPHVLCHGGASALVSSTSSSPSASSWKDGGPHPPRPLQSQCAVLDAFLPSAAVLSRKRPRWEEVQPEEEEEEAEAVLEEAVEGDSLEEFAAVAVLMALLHAEARFNLNSTGSVCVRAMEHVLFPARIPADRRLEAIQRGFVGRCVPPTTPEDALLAADLRQAAGSAYPNLLDGPEALAEVALAVLAWDGYDHVMRQLLPVSGWAARVAAHVLPFATAVLPGAEEEEGGVQYDTRLYARPIPDAPSWEALLPSQGPVPELATVRVHATTSQRCYHVVWNATSADKAAAALRASLHPGKECHLVDLANRSVLECRV